MIVGIMGKAGSGKDTVADIMRTNYGFTKVSFADPLKRICRDVFQFWPLQLWGPSEMRNAPDERYAHLTPRHALQQLGTEWGRKCYENIWIEYALRVAERLESGDCHYTQQEGLRTGSVVGLIGNQTVAQVRPGVVIPDVRFANEAEAIKKAGGRVVRVVRNSAGLEGTAGLHSSETEMDNIPEELITHYLMNNGNDLSLLESAVDSLVATLCAR